MKHIFRILIFLTKEIEKEVDMKKIINLEEKSWYEVIKLLKTSDYMELRKNSKTKEEEEFYSRLEEMVLRINQEKAIAEGIF